MKQFTKIFSALIAAIMVIQIPFVVFAGTSVSPYTKLTYTHNSRFNNHKIIAGIDVSQHNGDIDFKKVKDDGIEFAFIRVGYTGYTKSKFATAYDSKYRTYLNDAKAAGIKVGVYWYSQALNEAEATAEANKLLAGISGVALDMPVVYDYEFASTSAGRLDSAKLSKAQKTANALAFLNTVSAAGYQGCLYASENFLITEMNAADVASYYQVWLANYSQKANYSGDYQYWQYSSRGSVDGISGNTDVNFWYVNEDTIELDDEYYTGAEVCPRPAVIDQSRNVILTEGVDYYYTYSNNIYVGNASVVAVGINSYAGVNFKYRFKIVPPQVTGLVATAVGDNYMNLVWDASPNTLCYSVSLKNVDTGEVLNYITPNNGINISGLSNGALYTAYVSAGVVNAYGSVIYGENCPEIYAYTTGGAVLGFSVKGQSTTSVALKWNRNYNATSYNIYQYVNGGYSYVASVAGTAKSYSVKKLKANTAYTFKICAVVNGAEQDYGTAINAATTPKKNKLNSLKSTKTRVITAKWSKVNCSGYEIQWSTKSNFSSDYKSKRVSASKLKTNIKTSKRNKKYYVRVRAYKKVNGVRVYGKWTAAKSIKVR